MDVPARSPDRGAALVLARDLAARHPSAKLPCPVCGVSLRAENLDKHLAKVHPEASTTALLRWRGRDRAVIFPLTVVTVLVTIAAVGSLTASKGAMGPVEIVGLTLAGLGFALVVLTSFDALPATLTLDGEVLRLRYGLGLLRRSVRLPVELEVGTLIERRADLTVPAEVNAPGHDEKIGHYVRMTAGGRALTVASRARGGFAAHWVGWRRGPRRRSWDITLERPDLVALEYQLAARGILSLKTGEG